MAQPLLIRRAGWTAAMALVTALVPSLRPTPTATSFASFAPRSGAMNGASAAAAPVDVQSGRGARALGWGLHHPVPNPVPNWDAGDVNSEGQLGLGGVDTESHPLPKPVAGLGDVVALAAGGDHSLALRADGSVAAWGANGDGQLGVGTTQTCGNAPCSPLPVLVTALPPARAVAANQDDSLALAKDGTVWAWGGNRSGQLGPGTAAPSSATPISVSGLTHIIAIAAGGGSEYEVAHGVTNNGPAFNLALDRRGTVWAWGTNDHGELGPSVAAGGSSTPVPVAGLSGMVAIAAGGDFGLALKTDGTVWAWGSNYFNELGTATATASCADRCAPVEVSTSSTAPLSNVVAIAAGGEHALALLRDGAAWAWGDNTLFESANAQGQLFPIFGVTTSPYAVPVLGLPRVVAIAAGTLHDLALTAKGSVWQWGQAQVNPAPVNSVTGRVERGFRAIAAGGDDNFAIAGGDDSATVPFGAPTGEPDLRRRPSQPIPFTHQQYNFIANMAASGVRIEDPGPNPSLCSPWPPPSIVAQSGPPSAGAVVNCPHNEATFASPYSSGHPSGPGIGSADDYEVFMTPWGHVGMTVHAQAHLGSRLAPISYPGYTATGDPSISFDGGATAYLAVLGTRCSAGSCSSPDLLVVHSTDGGKTWSSPVVVASGEGAVDGPGIVNDKEFTAAWGQGNAIVTWTQIRQGPDGAYMSSSIYASVTHDGGQTWTAPVAIAGSAPFCHGVSGDTTCNQDQWPTPAVTSDGSIYVAFASMDDVATGSDQYLVVKVDPSTGRRVAGPYRVGALVDGATAYPLNAFGYQTLQDSQFRVNPFGMLTSDRFNPYFSGHLVVVWSDMRNSAQPAPRDPYQARTNSDIIISESRDGGQTWSPPVAMGGARVVLPNQPPVRSPPAGDQVFPSALIEVQSGRVFVASLDRSFDPNNHAYAYSVIRTRDTFAEAGVTTPLRESDPTAFALFFSPGTVNRDFPHPAFFIGDKTNIIQTGLDFSNGLQDVDGLWSDATSSTCVGRPIRCGLTQDTFDTLDLDPGGHGFTAG